MTSATAQPERRSTRKHRGILDAAARLAARQGYAETTIEGIAGEAGVGKQTIYRWWPSKAALYVEVYSELVSRAALGVGSGHGEAGLAVLLKRLFRLYRETPAGAVLRGLLGAASSDESARDAIQQGLVAGRSDIVKQTVAAAFPRQAEQDAVNEVVVALVWKRLLTAPESLDEEFAGSLAKMAMCVPRERDP